MSNETIEIIRVAAYATLILIGMGAIALYVFYKKKLAAAKQWPTAKGKVVLTAIEGPPSGVRSESDKCYTNRIRYRFEAQGSSYESEQMSIPKSAQVMKSKEEARLTQRLYDYNSEVTVFYNPDNPSESVLVHDNWKFLAFLAIAGFIMTIIGTIQLLRELN